MQSFYKTNLSDWQYRHLAQMMDAKTAIALARMPNVNSLFFLQPPYYHEQYNLHVSDNRFNFNILKICVFIG